MNLLKEFQRRNVIRMAGLSLVAAWLITQVAATLLADIRSAGLGDEGAGWAAGDWVPCRAGVFAGI